MFCKEVPLKIFIFLSLLCVFLMPERGAANDYEDYLVDEPLCTTITNREDRTVYGHVETARHPVSGNRHRSTFRLNPGESAQACTIGPFFDGYRVRFVIKGLVQLFDCKTKITQPIVISRPKDRLGNYLKNDRGFTIWAECS